jgi:hypothetical protein
MNSLRESLILSPLILELLMPGALILDSLSKHSSIEHSLIVRST